MVQKRLTKHGRDRRVLRVVEGDDHQAGVAGDVGIGADDRDPSGPFEDAVGVEGQLTPEEVVERVAVKQGAGRHEDQSLVAVGDIEISIEGMDRLLAVFFSMACEWGPERRWSARPRRWRTAYVRKTAGPAETPAQ